MEAEVRVYLRDRSVPAEEVTAELQKVLAEKARQGVNVMGTKLEGPGKKQHSPELYQGTRKVGGKPKGVVQEGGWPMFNSDGIVVSLYLFSEKMRTRLSSMSHCTCYLNSQICWQKSSGCLAGKLLNVWLMQSTLLAIFMKISI
jgi:hypothetical protein